MIDPALVTIFVTALTYGVCGSLVAVAIRFMSRQQPGPRLDQSAAVGFLVGAAFGALFGIFGSLLTRLGS